MEVNQNKVDWLQLPLTVIVIKFIWSYDTINFYSHQSFGLKWMVERTGVLQSLLCSFSINEITPLPPPPPPATHTHWYTLTVNAHRLLFSLQTPHWNRFSLHVPFTNIYLCCPVCALKHKLQTSTAWICILLQLRLNSWAWNTEITLLQQRDWMQLSRLKE